MKEVIVVVPDGLKKSAGVHTATQSLFGGRLPVMWLSDYLAGSRDGDVVCFSGFDITCPKVIDELRRLGKSVAVYWHFGLAMEADPDIRNSWQALRKLVASKSIDLFIACKKDVVDMAERLLGVKAFWVRNNTHVVPEVPVQKSGIGIYSGSSDYWVKNIPVCLYGALMTGHKVDVIPYGEALQQLVRDCNAEDRVTGPDQALPHDEFMRRLWSRELIVAATFTEAAPMTPIEALNGGTICLTGPNHDFWRETPELRNFLTVPEVDNAACIARCIGEALEKKDHILKLYAEWKTAYDKEQAQNLSDLIRLLENL